MSMVFQSLFDVPPSFFCFEKLGKRTDGFLFLFLVSFHFFVAFFFKLSHDHERGLN